MAARKALLVGINNYELDDSPHFGNLDGCVNDAENMRKVLSRHADCDENVNFECELLLADKGEEVTCSHLRERIDALFHDYSGEVLFYFAGHGALTDIGGYLVTSEGKQGDYGPKMSELVELAALSPCQSATIIIDACHSGNMGNYSLLSGKNKEIAVLPEGVTVMAASSTRQTAGEVNGQGIFTSLVVGALQGGAADIQGFVTSASIFSYVDQALGQWDQSPMFKTNDRRFSPLRRCKPAVKNSLLRELPDLFNKIDDVHKMDRTYEETEKSKKEENVAIFKKFKKFRDSRLLVTEHDKDLYYTAMAAKSRDSKEAEGVKLTPLGQYYWRLAKSSKI